MLFGKTSIIQPDAARKISAESVSQTLITEFPQKFAIVSQYGVNIPAIRLNRGNQQILVEVEMFDVETWPNRPQYNFQAPSNPRIPLEINGKVVHVLSAGWLLREKILSQAGREGSPKEVTDIADIVNLANIAGDNEVVCGTDEFVGALRRLLEKRPGLRLILKRTINCSAVFS